MTNPKNNGRSEIRLKVWIENGKLVVELTDARGHKNKITNLSETTIIELWTSTAYGNLFIHELNKLTAYDVITSEKIDQSI
jgi:hypothetical protein